MNRVDRGRVTLADNLAVVLADRGPLPACELALELRRRKADVLGALHSDPRFAHAGKRRASKWSAREVSNGASNFDEPAVAFPPDYERGEEALVELIRQGRRSPDEALLLVVCAVNA